MISNIHDVKICPECSGSNIVHNDKLDQVVCKDCGEIFEPLAPKEEKEFEKKHGL